MSSLNLSKLMFVEPSKAKPLQNDANSVQLLEQIRVKIRLASFLLGKNVRGIASQLCYCSTNILHAMLLV